VNHLATEPPFPGQNFRERGRGDRRGSIQLRLRDAPGFKPILSLSYSSCFITLKLKTFWLGQMAILLARKCPKTPLPNVTGTMVALVIPAQVGGEQATHAGAKFTALRRPGGEMEMVVVPVNSFPRRGQKVDLRGLDA
jgi:hypothetical protein